jgi:large subunit ribosomal protein L14
MSRKVGRGIRKFTPRIARGLPIGAKILCADNSGAKELQIITVFGYKGKLRKLGKAGIGDKVNVSVTKGKQDLRKQVLSGSPEASAFSSNCATKKTLPKT